MKKKRIIIGVIVILIILVGVGVFFYLKKSSDKNEKLLYGPVSNARNDYTVASIAQTHALIKKGELYGIADKYGNVVVKPKYKDILFMSEYGDKSKIFMLRQDSKSTLIDASGKEILSDEMIDISDYKDAVTGKEYFEIEDDLYDASFNKIYTNTIKDSHAEIIIDNKVYYAKYNDDENTNYSAYDLTKKEMLTDVYNDVLEYFDDNIYILGKKSIVINKEKKTITNYGKGYYDDENNKIVLEKDSKKINVDLNGNIYDESELTITKYKNGLYSDSKDCKNYGSKLYSKDGKIVNNTCSYYEDEDKYVTINNQGDIEKVFDESGKLVLESKFDDDNNIVISRMGNYYIHETYGVDQENPVVKIYDLNMKEHKPCNDNYYTTIYADKFACTSGAVSYLADIKGKKLTDNYENISCDDQGVCIINDNGKEGLYYNGKFVVPLSNKYNIVSSGTGIYAINQLFTSNTIVFADVKDSRKILNDIKIETEKLNLNQSVESIIKEYKLDDEKDEIKSNNEFFIKYAYIVLNDSNKKNFAKYLLDIFRVVVDHKDLLNEEAFLRDLRDLRINAVKSTDTDALGKYDNGQKVLYIEAYDVDADKIDITKTDSETMYHELLHFVDYSMNTTRESVYECDNKYYLSKELKEQNGCGVIYYPDGRIMVEGGAEFFSHKYFDNFQLDGGYSEAIGVYNVLEYIFGEKEMEKAFFSSNTEVELYKLMVKKAGISYEDFEAFLESEDDVAYGNRHGSSQEKISESFSKVIDVLIKTYEKYKKSSWKEDYYFRFVLSTILDAGYNIYSKDLVSSSNNKDDFANYLFNLNPYLSKQYGAYDTYNIASVIKSGIGLKPNKKLNQDYYITSYLIRNENNRSTLQVTYRKMQWYSNGGGDRIESGVISVDYDFENQKVKDYKQIYKEVKEN